LGGRKKDEELQRAWNKISMWTSGEELNMTANVKLGDARKLAGGNVPRGLLERMTSLFLPLCRTGCPILESRHPMLH
jgi:hypothetical protein